MEDSGIVDERKPGRKNPAHPPYVRTGWEAVVFEIEEIELPEAGADETVAGCRSREPFPDHCGPVDTRPEGPRDRLPVTCSDL